MRARRERDEAGAVAVVVAVMLVVLVGIAALAFDLGNAWARARAVQLQVDVSAMSAGHLLPMTSANRTAVAAEVASYLARNQPQGSPTVSGGDLLDGAKPNGEITFLDGNGTVCTDQCVRMHVLAPAASVDFAFAGVLADDLGDTAVQRQATVEAFSELPPAQDVIPLWLPSGCGYGPVDGDTTQGGASTTTTESTTQDTTVAPTPVGTHTLTGDPVTMAPGGTATVRGWQIGAVPSSTKKATLRLIAPDGSFFVDYAVSAEKPSGTLAVAEFQVGPEISGTPGTWSAYGLLQAGGNNDLTYSSTSITVEVGPTTVSPSPTPTATPTSVPVGCAGQDRGNFGQLLSPRRDVDAKQSLALNMALGLDHVLVPFDFTATAPTKSCTSGGAPIAGAVLDLVSQDGNNCIKGDTGNDGPKLYEGLIVGVGSSPGRLDVANGPTTCPGRTDRPVEGKILNDDVLSCFLRDGHSLVSISQESGVTTDMLDPRVMESPRFVWLPVVVATDRAQKSYQPILDFVPAFITGETLAVSGSSTPADNGVEVSGNSVQGIRLFAFNKDALPVAERSPTTGYQPGLGRPLVRLVE